MKTDAVFAQRYPVIAQLVDQLNEKDREKFLRVGMRPVLELSNDPRNARLHDEKNIAAIVESLQKFGQRKPIVVNAQGVVVAGNGTLEAARRIGWTHIVVGPAPENEQDQKAYAIADNRTAELASWDNPVLSQLLNELAQASYDVTLTGFSQDESLALIAQNQDALELAGPANPPEAPKVQNPPSLNPPAEPGVGLPDALARSSIRVVQLFMNGAQHAQWEVALRALSAKLGTKTASDTVRKAIFEAAGVQDPEVGEDEQAAE